MTFAASLLRFQSLRAGNAASAVQESRLQLRSSCKIKIHKSNIMQKLALACERLAVAVTHAEPKASTCLEVKIRPAALLADLLRVLAILNKVPEGGLDLVAIAVDDLHHVV